MSIPADSWKSEFWSPLRGLAGLVLIFSVLAAGNWLAIHKATDYVLQKQGTEDAHMWADYLAENLTDLAYIATGELPSSASLAFLEGARKSQQVFRYKIFSPQGYSQLISERERAALVDISEFNSDAAKVAQSQTAVAALVDGQSPEPAIYSLAFVPVIRDGQTIAVVAAYVDETSARATVAWAAYTAAAVVFALNVLSFGLPALAWYRRTREKQQADRRIRFLALHDVLTGLANRARLTETLNSALTAMTVERTVAVHFIDIDHFKEINDVVGHPGGDLLLAKLAQRLRDEVRAEDMVARVGGDEFVVIQRDVMDKTSVENLAARIRASLAQPIDFGGQEISTTISVGIAIAPADGTNAERLLKSADLALYKCKMDGRNCVRFFKPEMDAALQERIALEAAIRKALRDGGFVLHYQPVYEVANQRLVGFEALVRLPREDGTLIPPDTFIPLAEEMRVIDRIGVWVLLEACRTAATWPADLKIAVNLSPTEFEAGSISETVRRALDQSKLEPRRLELEITERLLLKESKHVAEELWKLKNMGVAIVMDDFGTGYSSLGYLLRFPFDKLKIDQSFIQSFTDPNDGAATLIKAMIALGRELKLRVTVEGVETAEQESFLNQAAGDQAQGYFLGRPLPASETQQVIAGGGGAGIPAAPSTVHRLRAAT